jgi:predicted glycosyltransferase
MINFMNPRLDILIYAHDGRGLGHISRSAAIAMACRRLYPNLRVLLVSGSRAVSGLIDDAPVDWIKLPAYDTVVTDSVSRGCRGPSGFDDQDLGSLRRDMLAQLMALYRPRCVLADHMPQGKHRELTAALDAAPDSTRWVLGIRSVVGDVPGLSSETAVSCFRKHYAAILWYGDTAVIGSEALEELGERFGTRPIEAGYVSRLREIVRQKPDLASAKRDLGGVVSIPWMGEHTPALITALSKALAVIGDRHGPWHLYIDTGNAETAPHRRHLDDLPFCRVRPIGPHYAESLLRAKSALVYGGYNSLTDVLYAATPAVVLTRGMRDSEQEMHVQKLTGHGQTALIGLPDVAVDSQTLAEALKSRLSLYARPGPPLNLDGADAAAHHLTRLLKT